MTSPKIYTKAWLKMVLATVEDGMASPHFLLNCIKEYVAHLDSIDAKRGRNGKASEKRIEANRINALKGGRPRKTKEAE